jgi:hypothetical protein
MPVSSNFEVMGVSYNCKLQMLIDGNPKWDTTPAVLVHIRPAWKWMAVKNKPAYYTAFLITPERKPQN